jgi:hypothetical protein
VNVVTLYQSFVIAIGFRKLTFVLWDCYFSMCKTIETRSWECITLEINLISKLQISKMKKKTLMQTINKFMPGAVLKFSILISVIVCFGLEAFASPHLASKQQIGMFKNSKTCVVLETGSISYNLYITDAVQKYWKSTEYEFIDQEKFELRRHDSNYSFLVLMKGVYDKDPGGVSYSYLSLVLGDAAYDVTDMPEFCSIPISYSDDNDTEYGYVIPAIVKFMQKHVNNLQYHRFLISLNGLKYYNSSISFKDKVLLLNKDKLATNANTSEKINTVYPYYVKLLNTTEIQTELDADPKNTLFNFHVGPSENTGSGKCFEMIFDTDGFLHYYAYRMVTNDNEDGFNLNDFTHLR